MILNTQRNEDGKVKTNSVNIIKEMGRMFNQYHRIINDVTIGLGGSFVDALTESI